MSDDKPRGIYEPIRFVGGAELEPLKGRLKAIGPAAFLDDAEGLRVAKKLFPNQWAALRSVFGQLGGKIADFDAKVPQPPPPPAPKIVADNTAAPPKPLTFVDMSNWDNEPVPERQWAVLNRIPLRQTTLHSGQGAVGKSTMELHRSCAHVLARDWLGSIPEPGGALFIDAEDDENEIHIRLAAICAHYGATFTDLIAGGLKVISLNGQDAVLAAPNRSGSIIEPTALYGQIFEFAGDCKPKSITIASAANVFAGNENDRAHVQQGVSLFTRLAIVSNGGLVLISHPSLTGINTNTGLSGTTQWHNSVRARYYSKGVNPADGVQSDSDLREIEFKKNQYGPLSEKIVVRYRNGLFLPEPGISSLEKQARNQETDEVFLRLLRRLTDQGQNLSPYPGVTYAAAKFAQHADAKGRTSHDFAQSMQRLLDVKAIHIETIGPKSKQRSYLRVGASS